jgi:hypothetical protein
MTTFAQAQGLLARQLAYTDVVATQFVPLWTA